MNDKPDELIRIQSWMQAVITHPAGIRAGVASESARQNIDVTIEGVEKVVSRSEALTGAQRLMIYSRAFYARLLECFRAEFPCLLHALGDDLFNHFVVEYLQHYPPRSYTLHDLAKDFPRFLAETRPDEREAWPDFIIDLATLERAFIETYDGPGAEGRPIVNADQILSAPPGQLAESRLVATPCLRLLAFRYPVLAYFNGVRQKREPELPAPSDTFLAINRKNYVVRFLELTLVQYKLLESLMANHTVAEAARANGHDPESLALNLRTWISTWAEAGFFIS